MGVETILVNNRSKTYFDLGKCYVDCSEETFISAVKDRDRLYVLLDAVYDDHEYCCQLAYVINKQFGEADIADLEVLSDCGSDENRYFEIAFDPEDDEGCEPCEKEYKQIGSRYSSDALGLPVIFPALVDDKYKFWFMARLLGDSRGEG